MVYFQKKKKNTFQCKQTFHNIPLSVCAEVFLDNVRCRGREYSLLQCQHNRWLDHDCEISEAAGVFCAPMRLPSTTPHPPTSTTASSSIPTRPSSTRRSRTAFFNRVGVPQAVSFDGYQPAVQNTISAPVRFPQVSCCKDDNDFKSKKTE